MLRRVRFVTGCRLAALLALCASAAAQSPPAGFEQVDFEIELGVLPGQLRFDKEQLSVRPGSRVKLTLANTDAMQHNFVLCARGDGVAAQGTVRDDPRREKGRRVDL